MTETGFYNSSGYSGGEDSLEDSLASEDAETVYWVDQTLSEAEQGGFLGELGAQVDSNVFADTTTLATVVEQARISASETPDAPHATLTREEIRERIFAKLRRPDGAPFSAGYTTGPAARLGQYEGEDIKAGSWRSPRNPEGDQRTTEYEDRGTIGERASGVDTQGRVVDANGQLVADGRWGWVIDEETGYLLLFDANSAIVVNSAGVERPKRGDEDLLDLLAAGYKIRATHHTTPVAGMPVTGAGLLSIEDGYIAEITDESGHYRPQAPQQYAALQALMDQGYSLEQAKVRLTGSTMGPRPTDKAEWLDEAQETNPNFPTGDITLRPEQFMQTGGDEYQIRMKQALNAEIRARGETGATTESPDLLDDELSDDDESSDDDTFMDEDGRRKRRVRDPERPGYWIVVDAEETSDHDDDESSDDDTFVDEDGRRKRRVRDPERPGYWIVVDAEETSGSGGSGQAGRGGSVDDSTVISEDEVSDDESSDNYQNDNYQNTMQRDTDEEGDSSAEEDPEAAFVEQARGYLTTAGRSAFAEWFRTLSQEQQDLLLTDPEIGSAWRAENAPPTPEWQPAENDHAAAATANAAFVDSLDDRQSAVFELGGFSLLIGDGHDARHLGYVQDAADHVTGRVTVRKAGLGRGAGSLTFTGVPPAKQGVVQEAVARFSRKEVRFGQ